MNKGKEYPSQSPRKKGYFICTLFHNHTASNSAFSAVKVTRLLYLYLHERAIPSLTLTIQVVIWVMKVHKSTTFNNIKQGY